MSRNALKILLGCALFAGLGASAAASAARPAPLPADIQTDDAKAYQQAYGFVLAEKWTEADKALADFLKAYPESRWSDDARYWKCYLLEKRGGSQEAAFNCYKAFVDDNPSSEWADDARANLVRIGRALADAGQGEYRAFIESLQADEDEEVALAALEALAGRDDPGARDAILALYDQSASRRVRSEIARMLAEDESPRALAKLREIISNETDEDIRIEAVDALGERRDAAEPLRQLATSSRDPDIQRAAVRALAERSDPQAIAIIKKLAAGLDNDSDEGPAEVGREAVEALGEMKGQDALTALLQVFKESKATEIRRTALRGLAERKDGLNMAALRETALSDTEEDVRHEAIDQIAERGGPEALTALKEIFEAAKDEDGRRAALDGIAEWADGSGARLSNSAAVAFLLEKAVNVPDDETARDAVSALRGIEKADREKLYEEVFRKAKSVEAKREALSGLIDAKKDRALEFVRGVLRDEPNPVLRETAVSALGEIRNDASVSILLNAAKNDADLSVRTAAVASLGEIGTPKAREALMEILKQKSPDAAR
jgi:HEAT repeat protein